MNIVTVDPSLSCTAMTINDNKFIYVTEDVSSNKKDLKKWFKLCEPFITYRFHNNRFTDDYSAKENEKLALYKGIVNSILTDILAHLRPDEETMVLMEGYSYSSAAGPLIDLVTIGTLIRNRLTEVTLHPLIIYPPTTLKLESAKLTYKPTEVGVKKITLEYRNNEGVSGGKFTKTEMYKALIENDDLQSDYINFLREQHEEVKLLKSIPKPIEDMNDAVLLAEIMKKKMR